MFSVYTRFAVARVLAVVAARVDFGFMCVATARVSELIAVGGQPNCHHLIANRNSAFYALSATPDQSGSSSEKRFVCANAAMKIYSTEPQSALLVH